MQSDELLALAEIQQRIDRTLEASPADETEIAWLEARHRTTVSNADGSADTSPGARHSRTVIVRINERGRHGSYRTAFATPGELASAVREALGLARLQPDGRDVRPISKRGRDAKAHQESWDPAIAAPDRPDLDAVLGQRLESDEQADLETVEVRSVVANSRGLRRRAEVTGATLRVTSGQQATAGRAASSARRLAKLDGGDTLERARGRRGSSRATSSSLPEAPYGLVLSPEAMSCLLDLFNRHALSSRSFREGTSWVAGSLGHQVFDAAFTLRDRGEDPGGLPFPFDLFGARKRNLDLVVDGVVRNPAVDHALAPVLGRPVTPLAVSSDDAFGTHLFLEAGALEDAQLAESVGEGLWVGWLDGVECWDPATLAFRARARGVRRIRDGVRGEAVGELLWEDRLSRLFSRIAGIGRRTVCLAMGDDALGAIVTPAVSFPEAMGVVGNG
ncbi:MAG: metallopeptidase TldD-related protein [Acidobacteriota bacterium]